MIEKFSVRKPFTVLVGVILIVVLGIVSFMGTSTDLLPAMDLPFSAIITPYIGATPEEVEQSVSIPIEGSMSTLSGISNVQSISNEHMSIVILEFTGTTNMDSASLEIREALDMLNLPDGVGNPMTLRLNPEMMPIMTTNVFVEGMEIDELSQFVQNTVAPAIEGVPGVAMVNLSGLVQNQLHVILRTELVDAVNERLNIAVSEMMMGMMAQQAAAMGVSLEQLIAMQPPQEEGEEAQPIALPDAMLTVEAITGILSAQNFAMPAGFITDNNVEYMVRVGDRFAGVDEIANMLIFDPAMMGIVGMEPIRLSDVADVIETDDSAFSFTQVNGSDAVMLTIQKQSEFSTADVTNAVRERLDALAESNDGFGYAVLMDQGEMIGIIIGSVLDNLLYGGILAILVLLIFLRDIRPTLIVAVSIPASLLLAFTLMYFTGVSLNMISMGGLALTVGMLVDNSIAVIENIYRMRATTSRSCARAAVKGTAQMAGPITAATITTISMFLPIVFTSGITRQLFADLGLTIAYSLLASLIIAMTVVPAASSVMLKKVKREPDGKRWSKFLDKYEKALRFSLGKGIRWAVLAFAIFAFVGSFMLINARGMEMFPAMDMGQFSVSAQTPEGTEFEQARELAREFAAYVLEIEDVETVGVSIGGGGMMAAMGGGLFGGGGGSGGTNIDMYVLMSEDRSISADELAEQVNAISARLGLESDVELEDGGMGMMFGSPISITVQGAELDAIRDTAIRLAEEISQIEGATNITDMTEQTEPELRIIVRKDDAMAHGLTTAQVFMAVNAAITTPERTIDMTLNGIGYEIVIKDGDFIEPNWATIENLQITTANGYVALYEIASIVEDTGFTSIVRMNRNRIVTITGDIEPGFNVGLINTEVERVLAEFVPEAGVQVFVGGEAEAMMDAFGDLVLMLILGLVFTYLIMVAQFQSLQGPFVIMFTIPLAFTGGFAGLMVAGMPLSIVSIIGLILLTGVAINNGIVLVSRITQMRHEGMAKLDAIIDAGRKRIRPIIMTAVSTIFAMSVIALGFGEGTEMLQPMAVATIGGLIYSTAMTLFVVPIIYDIFHRNKDISKENLDAPDIDD
ncbi:MAG: efflux RND transporter permease subunit [Defluviitaleaceae bacterium]|nr:efflux RND transporter permease subunit [Defluviitaleaceae bacterium]